MLSCLCSMADRASLFFVFQLSKYSSFHCWPRFADKTINEQKKNQ